MLHLVSCRKIWGEARHNAFTDLLYHNNNFYCCFREADHHAGGASGKIRIITSSNGNHWETVALISLSGIDLRDPMLSIMPDGQWLLNFGGTKWLHDEQIERNSYASFSPNGNSWSSPSKLPYPGEWIWRVTWNKGKGYAFSYHTVQNVENTLQWKVSLVVTTDGQHYDFIHGFDLSHHPNETTLRFLEDDTMVALARTKGPHGLIGHSSPPYDKWTWFDTEHRLGGPNFLIEDKKTMWACSRQLIPKGEKDFDESVVVARMSLEAYEPIILLPSSGDSSYAGMVKRDDRIYISYYSSHEGKSQIYFAELL